MHYYIDGYNLMFRSSGADDDLQIKRQRLILDLSNKIQFLQLNVTLVFDAQYQYGEGSRIHYENLEVFYTAAGETADEYILSELKAEGGLEKYTVVTSDKKLAWLARRRHARTETVEEFLDWLGKRYRNKIKKLKRGPQPTPSSKTIPKQITKHPLKKIPSKEASVEECFEFYLEIFEKQIAEQPQKKKNKKSSLKKNNPPPKKEEEFLSEMERWLRIFEG